MNYLTWFVPLCIIVDWNEVHTLRGLVFKELANNPEPRTKKTLNRALEKLNELMIITRPHEH